MVPPQPIGNAAVAPGVRGRRVSHEGGGGGGGGGYEYDAAPAPAGFAPDVVGGSSRNAMLQAKLARKQQENLRREQELRVRLLGLGQPSLHRSTRLAASALFFDREGVGRGANTLPRPLISPFVVAWVAHTQGVRQNYYEERKRADQLQKEQYSHNGARVQASKSVFFPFSRPLFRLGATNGSVIHAEP